ncbi:hypothetical protein CRE_04365 [Caenorhabditis remanei]|uniref:F-box domain-containing protein n=1 Tax=Caenorhabditis remanei TaxID=31234 RepID=E3NIC0_CAERE|nr:hypothetical protein CRE_04365 [Caenorhabditis remanei]
MNLLNLPDDNLLEIAAKLDLRGISILRKVNQRLRNFLDLRPPTNNFTKISIEGFIYYPRTQVIYESATGTETILYDDKDQAGRDFEVNIRYQKGVVDEFSINFKHAEDPVVKKIQETLKSRNKMLQVKKIFLRGNFQRGLFEILQFLDPTSLKTIATFMSEGDEIQQFDDNCVQLEQWRSAEEFTSNIMIESSACFSKLLHFREVNIWANEIRLEDVLLLRKPSLSNPFFECFSFHTTVFPEFDEFLRLLGVPPADQTDGRFMAKYFRIPNSSDVLLIRVFRNRCLFCRSAEAERHAGWELIEDIGTVEFFQR